MTAKINSQLEALREQERKLKARIKEIEAQAAAVKRKEDTRLKVLIGAAVLADAQHHSEILELIATILDRSITAQRDRDFLREKGWMLGDPAQASLAATPVNDAAAPSNKSTPAMDMSALSRTDF